MKRLGFIFTFFLVGLVMAFPVYAAEGSGGAAYNWSGFYLGVHGGYVWANSDSKSYNTVTGALVDTESFSTDHPYGGIQIGNDFMLTQYLLLGIDLKCSYHGSTNDRTVSNTAGTNIRDSQSKTDWSESAVVRLGYVYRNWLFYGLGGIIFDQGSAQRTQLVGTTGKATPGTSENDSVNRVGWTAGCGVEYGFSPGWSAFLEYRYNSFSTYTNTYPIAQRSTDVDIKANAVIIGVNYKFNWGSPFID